MNVTFAAAALSLVLAAAPVAAQQPAQQPPAQPQPKPATPPATTPSPTSTQPPRPFPEGAKIGFVDVQSVASQSAEGKAASAQIKALADKRSADIQARQKALNDMQQKLVQSGSVMNADAQEKLRKDAERQQVELQRLQQDANAEVQELQNQLQEKFRQRLLPVVEKVAMQKNLHFVLSLADSGIVWVDRGLDVTPDVIKALDAAK
jgi:outer membrane protein